MSWIGLTTTVTARPVTAVLATPLSSINKSFGKRFNKVDPQAITIPEEPVPATPEVPKELGTFEVPVATVISVAPVPAMKRQTFRA
jgi:hypothetical protein